MNVAMNLEVANVSDSLVNIAIEQIITIDGLNKRIDMGELKELADSIRATGVQNPIMVRAKDDKYELIAGHRRVEACKLAGLFTIPAIVKNLTDYDAILSNGIENLARKDLTPVEEGETLLAVATIMGKDGKLASAREVGRVTGKNNATVSARLKLAQASEMLKSAVRNNKLDCARADRLIKDGKDSAEHIAEAMKEFAIAKVSGSLKRADTINGVNVTPKIEVTPAPVKSDVVESLTDDEVAAAEAIASLGSKPVETKESVTEQSELPANDGGNLDIPAMAPKVTIVPAKEAPVVKNDAPVAKEPKPVHMDTIKGLLASVAALLRDEPTDSARYSFLQGVQYGYQVMVGFDTDPSIPEEWEYNL